jgi:uncharacterized RDD family membrane protein YckC
MKETILDNSSNVIHATQELNVYPSMLTRVKAMVIDYLVILILIVITSSIIGSSENFPVWVKIVLFIAILSYEPILTSLGVTLGQLLMGIRVRNIKNTSKNINLFFSFVRTVVKGLLGFISFVMISFTNNKRAIHDMAAMSIMVYRTK